MADDMVSKHRDGSVATLRSAIRLVKITSDTPFPVCRALHVGTAGTATITCGDGTVATDFPLKDGLNPYEATKVVLGTASDVWAVY